MNMSTCFSPSYFLCPLVSSFLPANNKAARSDARTLETGLSSTAKGLRQMHITANNKVCLHCKQGRPVAVFSYSAKANYTQPTCNSCRAVLNKKRLAVLPPHEIERRRIRQNEWAKSYKKRRGAVHERGHKLKSKYGITLEIFDNLLASQGGGCALCKTKTAGGKHGIFHVDHCHETNRVRGLLCHKCNVALGCLGDSKDSIQLVLNYVTEDNFPNIKQKWPSSRKGGNQ